MKSLSKNKINIDVKKKKNAVPYEYKARDFTEFVGGGSAYFFKE